MSFNDAVSPPRAAFLYTDEFLAYNLGPRHPLKQNRLQMVQQLLGAYGAFSPTGPVDWITPLPAPDDALARVHAPDYLQAVRWAGDGQKGAFLARFGLGPGDTPAFPGMYEAAALYAGGTIDAARLVLSGDYNRAFNVAGGLHHAHPDHASGFCTFNDCALGAYALLDGGCSRVAYIDIDAHHGDGVQACFYDDPRVLTISLHESGQYLYPGTGFPDEIGDGDAYGTSINVPFFPYTGDAVWHEAFDRVVPPALTRFAPDAYVLQVGADAHHGDPLAHLQLTSHGWMRAIEKLLALAGDKPVVVTGGGGYNIRTVARLWTMVTATCAGLELPNDTPEAYQGKYDIAHLHDEDEPDPTTAERENEARAYVGAQIGRLEELIGEGSF